MGFELRQSTGAGTQYYWLWFYKRLTIARPGARTDSDHLAGSRGASPIRRRIRYGKSLQFAAHAAFDFRMTCLGNGDPLVQLGDVALPLPQHVPALRKIRKVRMGFEGVH